MSRERWVRVVLGLTALVATSALAGCTADDKGPDVGAPASSSTAATTSAPTEATASALPVPAGVELTTQGSQLTVGDTATVAYQARQGLVGVLDITVTRLEKTTFKKSFVGWNLDEGQKKANPYFVRATVVNRGDTDLGGKRVPLYIVDGANTLVESTPFASLFRPCTPGDFPAAYPAGAKVKVCLVYLSPKKGDLAAVSFRPTQEDDPITWTGDLESPKPLKAPKDPGASTDPSADPS